MIIQFNPPAVGSELSVDLHARSSNPMNWLANQSNQFVRSECAPSDGEASKIVSLESIAYPEEKTLFPNYIEDIKAKWFKGTNSVALHLAEELLATTQEGRAICNSTFGSSLAILDVCAETMPDQSLPDAA